MFGVGDTVKVRNNTVGAEKYFGLDGKVVLIMQRVVFSVVVAFPDRNAVGFKPEELEIVERVYPE